MPNRTTNATDTHTHTTTTTPRPSVLPAHSNRVATSCWRLPNFWSRTITARSKRRRHKRRDDNTPLAHNNNNTDDTCDSGPAYPTAYSIKHNNNNNDHRHSEHSKKSPPASPSPLLSFTVSLSLTQHTAALALVFLTLVTLSACDTSPCDTNSWWDPVRDRCIQCTSCQGDMIPLRPCQLHRDTICGSIYDLKIDWVVLAKTEPNWKERRKSDELQQHYAHEELYDETLPLDWQTAALFLAVLACLLFFIVAACILIHHMRQWRRMERRLDQDVEELSTKLMAKLAEVQSLEGGTFFIGNADALRIPTTFQPQHVLLPEKSAKHHDRRVLKTLQPGNVYIEENSSKG